MDDGTRVITDREARWGQGKQVFHAALDEPPQKRHAYLQEVCAGDQGLLAEVERLLANDCLAGDFMEESAAGEAVQAIIQEHSRAAEGRHIVPYRLHRKQKHCRRCMRRETNCPSSRWAIGPLAFSFAT